MWKLSADYISIERAMARKGFFGLSRATIQEVLQDAGCDVKGMTAEYELVKLAIQNFENHARKQSYCSGSHSVRR